MSEMSERIAKVLADIDGVFSPWEHHRRYADKILEAMREPTKFMVNMVDLPWLIGDPETVIENTWRTMIDAALSKETLKDE